MNWNHDSRHFSLFIFDWNEESDFSISFATTYQNRESHALFRICDILNEHNRGNTMHEGTGNPDSGAWKKVQRCPSCKPGARKMKKKSCPSSSPPPLYAVTQRVGRLLCLGIKLVPWNTNTMWSKLILRHSHNNAVDLCGWVCGFGGVIKLNKGGEEDEISSVSWRKHHVIGTYTNLRQRTS